MNTTTIERTTRVNRFNEIVGERVRSARKAAKLSLAVLAAACGVSKATIEQVEEGRAISLPTLVVIAHELDTTLDALIPVDTIDVLQGTRVA